MRYSVYKFIKNLSFTMQEAFEYIKNSGKLSAIIDCVDAIEQINKVLIANKSSLKNENGIKLLNFEIFTISKIIELSNTHKDFTNEIDKLVNINKTFLDFVKNEINFKYKVAFFAELGSKWDSMDSVYRAFKSRNDCEVEVVIAPIFRAIKDNNGNVISDVLYKDYLTPLGIKNTPYQKYDISKDMPDIAFTSQPYESVTPEQFWAENISKYTRLVYLPYATFYGIFSKEDIYTQCMMPIHNLSWRVIVQSEKAKNEYSKYSQIKGKNLIDSGLPKWDYVFELKSKKIEMPKEWESKLKGKKVILWNTHYNLEGWIKVFFPKVNKFIDIVESNNEVAVIWRYHPLLETMFNLYYPEYKGEWIKLKSRINNCKSFVIDNNETYDWAFYFSDVMLTAASSLLYQYLFMDKPIYLIGRKEEYEKLNNDENIFAPYADFPLVRLTEDEIITFVEKIKNGIDDSKLVRQEILDKYFYNVDGKIGRNLVNQLILEMQQEEEN